MSTSCFQALVFTFAVAMPLCAVDYIPAQQQVVEQRLVRQVNFALACVANVDLTVTHHKPRAMDTIAISTSDARLFGEAVVQPSRLALPHIFNLPPPVC